MHFKGIARDVSWRHEKPYHLLTFRVEEVDEDGNVTGYRPVELRSQRIRNAVVDGDEVEVQGKMNRDGVVVPERISNLRTGARTTRDRLQWGVAIFLFPFVGAFVGFLLASSGLWPGDPRAPEGFWLFSSALIGGGIGVLVTVLTLVGAMIFSNR